MDNKKVLQWSDYAKKAREVVTEGIVLLENNGVLPLEKGCVVSIFGRIQDYYYKSGVGSGGMVNVEHVVDIPEGLAQSGVVTINEELHAVYKAWNLEHPYDEGGGWGLEPWSQAEMELTEEVVLRAHEKSDVALVILGRTAGEDRDMADAEGSYRLTATELDMLTKVRAVFESMVVLLNVGGIVDMTFIDLYSPDAVLYGWQGGMIGGSGIADILVGKTSPSGKLSDTIAYELEDYPAYPYFGDIKCNYYCEDIYVGYRYFETFARDKVRYPFGYGGSYTQFEQTVLACSFDKENLQIAIDVDVVNAGKAAGKEVCQVYVEAAQGILGRPARELISYKKTGLLMPGEKETIRFLIDCKSFAAYDDAGCTGNAYCFVLEAGTYKIYVGSDVRSAECKLEYELKNTIVTEQLSQTYAPRVPFMRMKPVAGEDGYEIEMEPVPLAKEEIDEPLIYAKGDIYSEMTEGDGTVTYTLEDVRLGRIDMPTFIGQLSDYDLSCIVSGEGMSSALVTPGTAAAFGGVSKRLREFGIPAVCCADGPSGIRMDCGTKAFSLPNGLMLGCSFNESLIEELYSFTGGEMAEDYVECLLGPGMNIQRYPLNGRNFEYFSEDPLVTGRAAIAMLKGLKEAKVTGVMKHFCSNNQELSRRYADSVISERALREIYLKGYRMAVHSGYADAVMTSYGVVNGTRTAICYDLNTKILRGEWGFDGIVMTDWWAFINEEERVSAADGYCLMARAQNDLFMVNTEAANNDICRRSVELLKENAEYRKWLRICADNICSFVMKTRAMDRLMNQECPVILEGRPIEENADDLRSLTFLPMEDYLEYDLSYKEAKKGTNYVIPIQLSKTGSFEVTLTGASEANELAQIPCSLFIMGTPVATFTFSGTGGKPVTIRRKCLGFGKPSLYRLNVGGNGLTLMKLTIRFISEEMNLEQ